MVQIQLVNHHLKFAESMSNLSSDEKIKAALGLTDEQCSLEGTKSFIQFIVVQEKIGKQLSRVILNEAKELIGVITLKSIDLEKKTAHIGTWIGSAYWGKGYNELAKEAILKEAFLHLNLDYVFAGATIHNIRSQKAQEKLSYMKLHVDEQFPLELQKIEHETQCKCILNVIEKADFLSYLESKNDISDK
ncbi:GNAT family N-acetyltransferase [Lysinibacillus sp. KU-BSD001]|uniref:GNAT family N-acetyltransferase n=1 Tax=Lysinibacillus sp. KU-BSD001 TaxID=3141328 RepID=UPI0036EED0B4